jgi:hypothetical protein
MPLRKSFAARPVRQPGRPRTRTDPTHLFSAKANRVQAHPCLLIEEEVMRKDIYQRVTDSIVAELERGVRPWLKPWNAEHAAGRITRALRSNLVPYQGINVLMLWAEAVEKGFAAPIWMTFKQALELG